MKNKHYIKTGIASLAIYFGIAVAAIGAHGMAHAAEYEALRPATQLSLESSPQAPLQVRAKQLSLHDGIYMKDTYKDVKLKLIGPLNLTIDDDHAQQRFTNLNTQRSQSVRSPFETNAFSAPIYYRSTIAKTGFKVKF